MTKTCIKCGCELIPNQNWTKSFQKRGIHTCKTCHSLRVSENYFKHKRYGKNKVPQRIRGKKQFKDRIETVLNQCGMMDGKLLFRKLKPEFGGKYEPSLKSMLLLCANDRQHRFIYKNKVMRLRTALEIQEYLVEHEIVGCAK